MRKSAGKTKRERFVRRRSHRDDYGQRWEIAAFLADGPRTIDEIGNHYQSYLRFMGLFNVAVRLEGVEKKRRMHENILESMQLMLRDGWVVEKDGRYHITDQGRHEAEKMLVDMRQAREMISKLNRPETVSRVSLAVHFILAFLKLAAGFLSGSIGLLNDAADTLLDGLSSLFVLWGIYKNKERLVNILLVVLMLSTGVFTFYEAVRRFFIPVIPEVSALTFLAAVVSLVLCGLLGLYQRYVGLNSGMMVLITQSIDSRNHVIVAAGVMTGLIFSSFSIHIVDTIIGLLVSILILKSGMELALETWRMLKEEDMEMEKYELGLLKGYERFRIQQLGDWMLYMVGRNGVSSKQELFDNASSLMDYRENPTLRELGWSEVRDSTAKAGAAFKILLDKQLIEHHNGSIRLTDTGRDYLEKSLNRPRRQWHFIEE